MGCSEESCGLQENREGKETTEEQKGKMEKVKERKAALRGCSKLPGKPLLRKLMPVREKKEFLKRPLSIEANPPKPQAEVLLQVMN